MYLWKIPYLREFSLNKQVFWGIRNDITIHIRRKPTGEREEHEHGVASFDDILLGLSAQTIDNVFAFVRRAFQPVG